MKVHQNLLNAVYFLLNDIMQQGLAADRSIERVLKSDPRWGSRDRRFIAETTYDIVRWYRLLKHAAGNSNPEDIYKAYTVFKKTAVDEAIYERLKQGSAIRAIRESIPDWLDQLGEQELGVEVWERQLSALNQSAPVILRANDLKTNAEDLIRALNDEGIEAAALESYPSAIQLVKRQNVFQSRAFKDGLFEVQDASSQLVAPFLQPEPGMRVIDACAGAGGKTLHLAAIMKGRGRILALDNNSRKLDELKRRARRNAAGNIECREIGSAKTIKRLAGSADRLLLDVPCSGLGVLRRNPDAKWKLSADFLERVKNAQEEILNSYTKMLKPGGKLVYATCSLLPSENELQVRKLLQAREGAFILEEEKHIMPDSGNDGFYMARLLKKN